MLGNIYQTFFIIIIIISLVLVGLIFWPYLTPFILAAIFASIFYPIYKLLLKITKNKSNFSAFLTCLIVLLLVIIPLSILLIMLSKEGLDIFIWAKDKLSARQIQDFLIANEWVKEKIIYLETKFNFQINPEQIREQIGSVSKNIGIFLYEQIRNVSANIFAVLLNFILLIFIMFYFFRDGKIIIKRLMEISPLTDRQEIKIINTFREVGQAVFWGNLVSSFLQGIFGGLGFVIFGLGGGFLFGFAIAIASLIPVVGTLMINIPATIYLLISGNFYIALGFVIYQLIFGNLIDNIIKPKLIESKIKIHPLLVFFSIFGGVHVFGLLGILYGPLIVTIFLTVIELYENDIMAIKNSSKN